jgi:predicted TIM-barrel fold metal-dependent hydrolase
MRTCAIDIHHHYVPNSLLEECKKRGKQLGVELIEKDGQRSLSFAGGPPFVFQADLSAIDERLKMMQDYRLAMAALEAHTATLGYRLTGEQGENWCRVYNEGINDLIKRYPDRFVGMASVPLQDPTARPRCWRMRFAILNSAAATSAPTSTAITITAPISILSGRRRRSSTR